MSAGSKAFFSFTQCIDDYLVPNSDEYDGCSEFEQGTVLDVNIPADKQHLRGVVSGLRKIADAIERDAHLNKRPTGKK